MEQPPSSPGFPERYDPKAEVEDIFKEDHAEDKRKAASESVDRFQKARDYLNKSRVQVMQGVGLMAGGALMASTDLYLGATFEETIANSTINTIPTRIVMGMIIAMSSGMALGGLGGGIAKLVNGFKGIREGARDKGHALEDVRHHTGNPGGLR